MNFFKWVHDELVALRAAIARLEAHTSAPVSHAIPKPADAVPPADFGPPPPPGVTLPPEKPAEPPAPPVVAPAPLGVNTTDPVAPGFVMPTNIAPPAPVVSSGPDCSGVLGPDCGQMNNVFIGSKEIGAQGRVIVTVNDTPQLGGTQYPLQVTVGDQKKTIITDGANVFEPVDTPVTVTASSAVVMQFRAA